MTVFQDDIVLVEEYEFLQNVTRLKQAILADGGRKMWTDEVTAAAKGDESAGSLPCNPSRADIAVASLPAGALASSLAARSRCGLRSTEFIACMPAVAN